MNDTNFHVKEGESSAWPRNGCDLFCEVRDESY